MSLEHRPTSVTVIGWAWIVIGGLMILSGGMALLMIVMMGDLRAPEPHVDLPFLWRAFPYMASVQIVAAALGVVSGISFLGQRDWARKVLEVLSWLALASVVMSIVVWITQWVSMSAQVDTQGFAAMGVVMATVVAIVHGVPFAIMIRYLRSAKVRGAMRAKAS